MEMLDDKQTAIELIKSMLAIENKQFYTIYEITEYLKNQFKQNAVELINRELLMELCSQLYIEDDLFYYIVGDGHAVMLYKANSFLEWQRYSIGTIYKPRIKVNNKEFNLQDFTLYVYESMTSNSCINSKHRIENVKITTRNIKGNTILFNGFYCHDCEKYFTSKTVIEDDFPLFETPLIKIKFGDFSGSYRREQSELMIYGYNAKLDGPTDYERQSLLAWFMTYGILSKSKIVQILLDHINYNGKKINMVNAVKKWKSDLDFVNNYGLNQQREIKAKRIHVFYKGKDYYR